MSQILDQLIDRFPQLSLPVVSGMSTDPQYREIVRKGKKPAILSNPFHGSERDALLTEETPVGPVNVIRLGNRDDFVRFVQVMAHRCEPVEIPASMGAVTISGVTSWEKIRSHRKVWTFANPGGDWAEEFRRFTSVPGNITETLLIVSEGPYSAVPAVELGLDESDWLEKSLRLRTGHELTHLVSRSLWPENKQAIRDEITADCIGLLFAFGDYDPVLAARLLGIRDSDYLPGGRLQNYLEGRLPDGQLLETVSGQIGKLRQMWIDEPGEPFVFLKKIEENRIGLEDFV